MKKSWVLVVDNEGNTFWCAKYESIVGRKCFSSSRLPSSFAVSHVLVTRERIAHRKVAQPTSRPRPTLACHSRVTLCLSRLSNGELARCRASVKFWLSEFSMCRKSERGDWVNPCNPPSHDAPSRAASKEARERVVSSAWTLGILSHFAVWWTAHLCFVFCHLTKNSSVLKAFCFQDDGRYCSERCWSPRVCWILR